MSLFYLALGFLAGRISCSALPALMTNVSGRAQGRRGVHNNSGEQLLDKTRVTKYRDKPVHHKSEWVVSEWWTVVIADCCNATPVGGRGRRTIVFYTVYANTKQSNLALV